ncbi:s-methyl-5-thioribose-1-phosphate isomerase [Phreatobacter stygius]|uniref:S-methyl-5-thioribose-1-phosphate isomerase n=1 Tax=Phreatobacter stygius TaxID=1940610 RepID=A0A4D7B3P3_9HYPH|nr:s-methyl-5-thioribose-1-phosphate isomerase [Phreatobacter stygius]QCI67501.1 S-methyl-5-thioribose-1-phosphate isomerase [Phreatobacter stygius]
MHDISFTAPTLVRQSVLLDEDAVRILDRRTFPFDIRFVTCTSHDEVAVAIEDMVTQSSGPFFAASAGMVLAARLAARSAGAEQRLAIIDRAAARLIATRPTNNHIRSVVTMMAEAARGLPQDDFAAAMQAVMEEAWEKRYAGNRRLGRNAAELVADGDTILTHCWAEASLIETLAATLRAGKRVKVVCTETRPYLQGSRLTAHSVAEMGIDVTVITDNMAAHAMDRGLVSRYMTAADRVTLSGHVINKVGTLQIAIAARHFGIPYIAMVPAPDRHAATPDDVPMEQRDGRESLMCLGQPTATPLARGWYPAFDVTPPEFVGAIATGDGVFAANALRAHFGG